MTRQYQKERPFLHLLGFICLEDVYCVVLLVLPGRSSGVAETYDDERQISLSPHFLFPGKFIAVARPVGVRG